MSEHTIITGDAGIENVRRATIRAALRLKVNHGMWPNRVSANLTLPAVRSYGWTGRTAKSAFEFMNQLGDVPTDWKRDQK